MPLSYENYTGDNATTQFSIPFTYQNTTEISVTVDGVAETGLTFPSSSTVQLTSAPATGAIVQVRRTTDLSARAVDFASGSVLTEEDLDDSAIQAFHAAQEAKDVVNDTITLDTDLKWDADNKVIKDVANPVNLQDAATKNYIENTWLTTSDKAQLNSLNIANLNSVATNLTDVNTVATNISDVNAFAQVYRSGATDPTTSLDVGDLFYNTTSNLLKIWSGSSWETGVAGASGLLPLSGGTMTGNIAFSGSQTVDGRDVSADGNKLDNIEANADVTDAANVNPLVDAHLNTSTATVDQVLGWTGTDYDWVNNDSGSGDLLAANNLSDLTNTTTARANLGVAIGSDVQAHSSVLDGTTASFTTAEESKLAGIEASATADQTGAEIKAAYEAEANTNAFTDAEKTKLTGIEIGATADQTGAEIKAAYEAEANAFTDAQFTKLTGIEAGATADQTASEILTAIKTVDGAASGLDADLLDGQQGSYYTNYADTAVANLVDSAPAALDTLNELAAALGDDANFSTTVNNSIATKLPLTGGALTGAVTTNSTFDGRNVSVDGAKLDGIEAGATADQSDAEIKTAYENNSNTNAFTDAEKTKLTGIEAGATADQTASEIRALVESATDSNVFTDADHTKLNGIEASADVTDVTNVTAAGALMDSEVTNLAQVKSFDSSDYATAVQGTTADAALPRSGGALTGAVTTTSTFDGRDVATDGAKLDGIEAGATADQTAAEIRTLVESATDSNVFTDADHTKLNDISVDLYGENPVSATAPSVVGNNAIAIGSGSVTSADNNIAIGTNATTKNLTSNSAVPEALSMGTDSQARDYCIAIGREAYGGLGSVAIGSKTNSAGSTGATATWSGVAVGNNSTANGFGAVAIGYNAYANNGAHVFGEGYASSPGATSLGTSNISSSYGAQANSAVAIGYVAKATGAYGIAIGNRVWNTTADQISIGHGGSITGTPEKVQISESYTLPTADGTNGQVMTTDGAGTVSFTTVSGGGGGSPDLFDESYDGTSTAPSATGTNSVAIGKGSTASGQESMAILDGNSVSQDSFSVGGNVYANAIGGTQIGKGGIVGGYGFAANYGVSIGYQAVVAKTESIAIGKAYSGGINSFAAQITDNTSTYGASGNNSIAIGQLSKATQTNGVAIGKQTSSLATEGVSIGTQNTIYSPNGVGIGTTNSVLGTKGVGLGTSTYVSATYGMAFGFQSRAFQQSQFAFAAGHFASFGDAQGSMYILRCATTDATPTVLTTDGGASASFNQIEVQTDQCLTFDGTITAMQNGAQSYASWRVEGLLVNDGGTTTVANSAITVIDNQSNWGLTLTADTGNNCLAITFTGEAAHNIRTVANIRTSEVTYA